MERFLKAGVIHSDMFKLFSGNFLISIRYRKDKSKRAPSEER